MTAPAGAGQTSAAPLIAIERLSKRFGAHAALDEVSLGIEDGEFLCVLGPSGCGKSTLLRLLAGFETPDSGSIRLDGRDLAGVPPHRRPLNTMVQTYALFPHMSVAGNVGYGLRREGLPRATIAARVDELLALVQLEGLGSRHPAQLSGGQRQRVALARALAKRPRVLLLDEPLAALDARLREATQRELKTLQARLGTTFVVVSHDQAEAMAMADRICVMDRGRVVQLGAPREVYERPRTPFVAGFLGAVTLLPGRVVGREGGLCTIASLACADHLVATLAVGVPPAPGEQALVAVRPERFAVARPDDGGPNLLRGRVEEVAYRGGSTELRVALADGTLARVTILGGGEPPRTGETIVLRFAPEAATVLPA